MIKDLTYSIGGIILSEPNLFLSDMVLAMVAFYCYTKIKLGSAVSGYANFFLLTGVSAAGSGFGHLFTFYTDEYLKVLAWIFSLTANYFIIQASARQLLILSTRKFLSAFAVVKLVSALGFLFYFQKFHVVTIDTVISIGLISLPVHFQRWKQTSHPGYKLFCLGILFTMLTAVVGGFKLSISENWFNHKDLNHLIICGGMLLMYKAINQL